MNKISWYIFRQLTVGMILVSFGLAGIIWLSQAVGRLDVIVNKVSTMAAFIYLTLLLIPNFLTIVLPIALFTVVIFIYSKMNADRELVILRAAGVSPFSIAKPALPMSASTSGSRATSLPTGRSGSASGSTRPGIWRPPGGT